MELKEVSSSLARRRMDALVKGKFDQGNFVRLSFLVGPEGAEPQEIDACKFDLVVASEYFEGLLRSPLTPTDGPIRMKHVEPDIFKLVVEFTHTCGHLVTEVNDLEQWLKLAEAADEFLLDELGQLCSVKLGELINLDNVWTVFSTHHLIRYASAACENLLKTKTVECLRDPNFLEIKETALTTFLRLKKMKIESEMQLVLACLKFVKGKEDERALFRQCALPHLRLLTLSAEDLSQLAPFLENDEKMFLSLNFLEKDPFLIQNNLLDFDIQLCKEIVPRNPVSILSPTKRVDFVSKETLWLWQKSVQK